jgi:hypothetical protein
VSVCGGLPATGAAANPWGYKFSWFPRAVFLAARQPARFLRNGQVIEVPGPELFAHRWPFPVPGQGVLEIYPNRDSLAYRAPYGLAEVGGGFRGTSATRAVRDAHGGADLPAEVEEETWPAARPTRLAPVPGAEERGDRRRALRVLGWVTQDLLARLSGGACSRIGRCPSRGAAARRAPPPPLAADAVPPGRARPVHLERARRIFPTATPRSCTSAW